MSGRKGARQYCPASRLALRMVRGSVSVMALVTRVTSTTGPRLPSPSAVLAGRQTRSSLQMGAISALKVYL